MDLKEFKQLRRHYGVVPAMRIYLCQSCDIDVFQADKHIGPFLMDNNVGKVERMTSKSLYAFVKETESKIKEEHKRLIPLVRAGQEHLIKTILTKK